MKLYHFTAAHLWPAIKLQGLRRGVIPDYGEHKLIPGYQWLTRNPDWSQAWDVSYLLPYRRNAVRITVKVPQAHAQDLRPWLGLAQLFPETASVLNGYGDPENWFVFSGNIPRGWFREVLANQAYAAPRGQQVKTDEKAVL